MSPPQAPPLTFRPAAGTDHDVLSGFTGTEPVAWIGADRLREEREANNFRDEWCWLAERDGHPVARALWWGSADASRPSTLDCLLVSPAETDPGLVGGELMAAAHATFGPKAPEFNVDLEPGWRQDPAAVAAAAWRQQAAHASGLTQTVERISYEWLPASSLPEHRGQLRFREGSNLEFRGMFAMIADGTLDAHTVETVAELGVDGLADDDLEFYLSLPGRRDAWQLAENRDGEPVGFIIPTRTAYDASISCLGVLPEHRGHGHVNELLAEMVRVHHADDATQRVVGTTDAANVPMRQAFERAGFDVTRTRIVHSA